MDTYALTVTDQCGNLFVDEIEVNVTDLVEELISAQACVGDTIIVNNEIYTETGSFQQNLTSVSGCDSLLVIELNFLNNTAGEEEYTICDGDSITINGQTFTTGGVYDQELQNVVGCDSLLSLTISVLDGTSETEEFSVCSGNSISVNGESYSMAGIYEQELINTVGCDSTLTVVLELLQVDTTEIETTICEGESVLIAGQTFESPGLYNIPLLNSVGCDSTLVIRIFDEGCVECDFLDDGMVLNLEVKKLATGYEVQSFNKRSAYSDSELEEMIRVFYRMKSIAESESLIKRIIQQKNLELYRQRGTSISQKTENQNIYYKETMQTLERMRIGTTFNIEFKF